MGLPQSEPVASARKVKPAPTGDEALALFDRLVLLSETPGFYELKRSRDTRPQFGDRP